MVANGDEFDSVHGARSMSSSASPSTDVGRKVVHRKEIDYTNLWPIFLAPVIPAAGILLRCVVGGARNAQLCVPRRAALSLAPDLVARSSLTLRCRPYPQYRWPVIGAIGGAILFGAHGMVIGSGVSTK